VSEPAPSRTRRWLAAAAGLVAALVATDLQIRATGIGAWNPRFADYHFQRGPGEPYWRMDPARPPEHRWDGDPFGHLPPGAAMTYPVNSAGLRGPLPAPGRPAVLVVGDSFTFGEGVAVEDTFVARLEAAFAAPDRAQGPAFVNAGVPGYGSREEAARLPFLLERFEPTAVLVVFTPNDAVPLDDSLKAEERLLAGSAPEDRPGGIVGLVSGVLARPERDAAVREWQLSYYTGDRRKEWDATRAALAQMQAAAKTRRASFGVAFFPVLEGLRSRPLAPIHDLVAAACRDAGVPFLDLSPALEGMSERELWVHPTDHHPSAAAHAAAAEALRPFVAGLLR
jgi:lysophospholipase L1-like esterase